MRSATVRRRRPSSRLLALIDGELPSGRQGGRELFPFRRRRRAGDDDLHASAARRGHRAAGVGRLARDEVRLSVRPSGTVSTVFRDLPDLLDPGDLVVVNTSAISRPPGGPAGGRRRRSAARVDHAGRRQLGGGGPPSRQLRAGPGRGAGHGAGSAGAVRMTLVEGFPRGRHSRLWRARTEPWTAAPAYLSRTGSPSGYGYLHGSFPLASYQNVYATEPGSAEMASAGRPSATGCWCGSSPGASRSCR